MKLTERNIMDAAHNEKILISTDGQCRVWYDKHTDRIVAAFDNCSLGSIFMAVIRDWIGTYAQAEFIEGEYN